MGAVFRYSCSRRSASPGCVLQDQSDGAIKFSARIGGRYFFACVRYGDEAVGLTVFHRIVADVVDQFDRFWMAVDGFGEFGVGRGEIFFLAAAISGGIVAFGGVEFR